MPSRIDPRVREVAEQMIAEGKNKRAVAVLKALLDKGTISTDELQALGYNHPPRAIGDVRDAGIPIVTGRTISKKTGRSMAVYSFGDPSQIQEGRIGGRSSLPKAFKAALIQRYGTADRITGATLDPRLLQIDHRVPYRIAADAGLSAHDVESYMLLDASSQRSKSWSCERCPNMTSARDPAVCKTCFWAYPENYQHIATQQIRRTHIVWQDHDVNVHDRLKALAERQGITVAELLRRLARQKDKPLEAPLQAVGRRVLEIWPNPVTDRGFRSFPRCARRAWPVKRCRHEGEDGSARDVSAKEDHTLFRPSCRRRKGRSEYLRRTARSSRRSAFLAPSAGHNAYHVP